MTLESTDRLAELAGVTHRTARRRLAPLTPVTRGRAHLYESAAALRAILRADPKPKTGSVGTLEEERAKLAAVQREAIELKLAAERGRLVPADEVVETWSRHILAARSAFFALPSKLAHELAAAQTPAAAAEILRASIRAILTDLSGADDGRSTP